MKNNIDKIRKLRKLFSFFAICVLVLCLVGCVSLEASSKLQSDNDIYFWTDSETGVCYIIFKRKSANAGMGGICPRYNADGTLYIEQSTNNGANNE